MALQKGTIEIPLVGGMGEGEDDQSPQSSTIVDASNVAFDKGGVVKKMTGTATFGLNITPSGSITGSDVRRVATREDELLLFTKDKLYSWVAAESKWSERDTYYAVSNSERQVANKTTEQRHANKATLLNTTCYVWSDLASSTSTVHCRIEDNETGAAIVADYEVAADGERPRVYALDSSANHYLILFTRNSDNTVRGLVVDPTDAETDLAVASTLIGTSSALERWDACKVAGADIVWVVSATAGYGSYWVNNVGYSAGIAVGPVETKAARSIDNTGAAPGSICITHSPDAVLGGSGGNGGLAVARASGAQTILVDFLDELDGSDLVVGTTDLKGSSVTETVRQITAVWKDPAEDQYHRCYVFWEEDTVTSPGLNDETLVVYNYQDSNPTPAVGTIAELARWVGIGSKAFLHDGVPCINLCFNRADTGTGVVVATPQASYFLYHLDEGLIGQASQRDAGFPRDICTLPEVLTVSSGVYTWAGEIRRRFIGNSYVYAETGLNDITYTFDSDLARRTAVIGRTMYLSGSVPMQYDGRYLCESGFVIYSWDIGSLKATAPADIEAGTYYWKSYFEAVNGVGERSISTSTATVSATLASNEKYVPQPVTNGVTRRISPYDNHSITVWRTEKNPGAASPFYRVTSPDPSLTTGDNKFLHNSVTAYEVGMTDDFTDAELVINEQDPLDTNFVIDNLSPPPCTIMVQAQNRLWAAGLSNKNLVWYSKHRTEGFTAEFSDELTMELPAAGGPVTAIAALNESVIIFKESAVYVINGYGPSNTRVGSYGEPTLLSPAIGCTSQDLITETPVGLMFMSRQGIYLLGRDYQLSFIGSDVEDSTSTYTYVGVATEPDSSRVRWLSSSSGRQLVYDYQVGLWSRRTSSGVGATIYNNLLHIAASTGIVYDDDAVYQHSGSSYNMEITTSWLRLSDKWDYHRLRHIFILGKYRAATTLVAKIAYDGDPTWVDTFTWTVTPTVAGEAMRLEIRPSRQKAGAVKIYISDGNTGAGLNNSFDLTSMVFEVGYKRGTSRLPAVQRT